MGVAHLKVRRMIPLKAFGLRHSTRNKYRLLICRTPLLPGKMLTRYLMKPSFPISQMTILNLRHLTLWTLKPTVGDVLNDVCAFCRWLQISRHRTGRRNKFFLLIHKQGSAATDFRIVRTTLCRSVTGNEMTCLSRDSNPRQSVVEWPLAGTFEGRSTN